MHKFSIHEGLAVPLMLSNLDTDRIIPKQFLTSVQRTGFGVNLFDEMRYHDKGHPYQSQEARRPRADFVLNMKRYEGASILLAGSNFGCGSSREHAVWALYDFGIQVILAPSFADIFINNCSKNGLLCIAIEVDRLSRLARFCEKGEGLRLKVNLQEQMIYASNGEELSFDIDGLYKQTLLAGLDDIALSLRKKTEIRLHERKLFQRHPWLNSQV